MTPAKKKYRFGEHEFTSKNAASKFFSDLRKRYVLRETISNGDDIAAISDLLHGHCQRDQKIGSGVKRFYSAPAPDHPNTTCFWIERIQGPDTDFGFQACFGNTSGLNHNDLRKLTRPHTEAFRAERFAETGNHFTSELSGETAPREEAEVDHVIHFQEIVALFCERERISIGAELLTIAKDATSEPTWRDEALAARFIEYHEQFPLRLVTAKENRSRSRWKSQAQPLE